MCTISNLLFPSDVLERPLSTNNNHENEDSASSTIVGDQSLSSATTHSYQQQLSNASPYGSDVQDLHEHSVFPREKQLSYQQPHQDRVFSNVHTSPYPGVVVDSQQTTQALYPSHMSQSSHEPLCLPAYAPPNNHTNSIPEDVSCVNPHAFAKNDTSSDEYDSDSEYNCEWYNIVSAGSHSQWSS